MRIAFVVHSFVPHTYAGTEVYSYGLAEELSKRHKVAVFYRVNNRDKKDYQVLRGSLGDIELFAINNTFRKVSSFSETYDNPKIDTQWVRFLDSWKPDVIHIQHLLFLSLGVIREARNRDIPIVYTLNDYWLFCHKGQLIDETLQICEHPDESKCQECIKAQLYIRRGVLNIYYFLRSNAPQFLLKQIKNLYLAVMDFSDNHSRKASTDLLERGKKIREAISKVDIFIAPSKFMQRKTIQLGIAEQKILQLGYGVKVPVSKEDIKKEDNCITFGFIGTLLPMKGIGLLVEVFKRLKSSKARLRIYGKLISYVGHEKFLSELRLAASFDPRIMFMGEIPNAKVADALRDIDVLVVPSLWQENSPLVILEALANRVPVLASNSGGIPELISDKVTGFTFQSGDPIDLKDKLELIVQNQDVLNALKQNIKGSKSMEENSHELEKVYSCFLKQER